MGFSMSCDQKYVLCSAIGSYNQVLVGSQEPFQWPVLLWRSLTKDLKGISHKVFFLKCTLSIQRDSGTSLCPTWMPLMKAERRCCTGHGHCVNRLLESFMAKPISIRHFSSVVVAADSPLIMSLMYSLRELDFLEIL